MTKASLALAIAAAGCGRLNFQDITGHAADGNLGGDGATGDLVTLVIASDEYLAEPAGLPIAGATVLIERAGGTERLTTDATGTVQFSATGAIACHAIYKSDIGWRGYTIAAPPAGKIELGSRPASNPTHNMTFTLPASATAEQFTVRLPEHCATPPMFGAPSMGLAYEAACEGTTPRVIGFALTPTGSGNPNLYLDAGFVALANGTTHPITGSYAPLVTRTLQITNLPLATDTVRAEILARTGLDLTSLTPSPRSITPGSTTASLDFGVVPGGNTLRVQVVPPTPISRVAASERIAPLLGTGNPVAFDVRTMLPALDSLTPDGARAVRWTGGGTGGTITIVEAIASNVQWDAYLPPTATSMQLLDLPPDLGVPIPKSVDVVAVVKLDIPGATAADLLPTIDRRWPLWPHDPMLLPPAGSSNAHILYSAALGPP